MTPFLATGSAALVAAHLFDGHTVVEGRRVWTGLFAAVHVAAAAGWVGGVVLLAAVAWRRHRSGRRADGLDLAARFSVVAAGAVIAVGVAGLGLAATVLDSPSGLWTTDWGRVLVVKTGLVGVAGSIGGYNHRVLLPLLADRDRPDVARRLRTSVSLEAGVLVAVVAATAVLVGAAS